MNDPENITNIDASPNENPVSNGFKKSYNDLLKAGWNPRKAKRYLNSIASRNFKKLMKNNKGKYQNIKEEMIKLTNEGENNEI